MMRSSVITALQKIGAGGMGEVYKVLRADRVTAFTKPLDDLAIANAQNGGGRQQLSAEKSLIENESIRTNINSFA